MRNKNIEFLNFVRVFDQYEIDIEITKHRHSYLNIGKKKKHWNPSLTTYKHDY